MISIKFLNRKDAYTTLCKLKNLAQKKNYVMVGDVRLLLPLGITFPNLSPNLGWEKGDFCNNVTVHVDSRWWIINFPEPKEVKKMSEVFTVSNKLSNKFNATLDWGSRDTDIFDYNSWAFDRVSALSKTNMPRIEKVIHNDPATIVYWGDGTKTVVKCNEDDEYSGWAGLAFCIAKKYFGNKFHHEFKRWCPEPKDEEPMEFQTWIKAMREYTDKTLLKYGKTLEEQPNEK